MEKDKKEEVAKSSLVIEFVAPGSALFGVQRDNVSPLQILALSSYLELMAKNEIMAEQLMRAEQLAREEGKIAVPDGVLRPK